MFGMTRRIRREEHGLRGVVVHSKQEIGVSDADPLTYAAKPRSSSLSFESLPSLRPFCTLYLLLPRLGSITSVVSSQRVWSVNISRLRIQTIQDSTATPPARSRVS